MRSVSTANKYENQVNVGEGLLHTLVFSKLITFNFPCLGRSLFSIFSFSQEIQYRAQGRSKSVCEEMMKLRGPEVQPFLSETWHEQFHIPPVPPTELGGCKLIELSYLLKVNFIFNLHPYFMQYILICSYMYLL